LCSGESDRKGRDEASSSSTPRYFDAERALTCRSVDDLAILNVPVLKQLANTIFPFQGMAASLAVQAKIMPIILATRNPDFVGLEIHCDEAVRFGELSGNKRLLALALEWQGNTNDTIPNFV
jgi:hypothetical protein